MHNTPFGSFIVAAIVDRSLKDDSISAGIGSQSGKLLYFTGSLVPKALLAISHALKNKL